MRNGARIDISGNCLLLWKKGGLFHGTESGGSQIAGLLQSVALFRVESGDNPAIWES